MPPTILPAASQEPAATTPAQAPAQHPLHALLHGAALVPLPSTGWLRITGSDRVRWLNGMVTNSIGDLTPGAGNYNLFLSAQGRIQADGCVFAEADHLLLETSADQIPNLLNLLDRFIIMDDVELAALTSTRSGLLLAGPEAPGLLQSLNLLPTRTSPSLTHLTSGGRDFTIIAAYSPLVPRFELWSGDPSNLADLRSELLAHGAVPGSPEALNQLRILEGTPLFGTDIRDRDLPQETGATRALHFSKGCYLGQEIVERIRSRGNVHRTFSGFHLLGAPAVPGAALSTDGKPVGELTSITSINGRQLALGYIRREALALGRPILFEGGTATPVNLPFEPS